MKKEYKDLELEVVNFTAEDVITASGAPGCDKDCPEDKCRKILCEALSCYCDSVACKCTGPSAYEAP